MGANDDQTMLVLVRQVSQDGEKRWVMRPAEFLCIGLMQRKLLGGLVFDVAENRRAGKPLQVIADRELNLLRLFTSWFPTLGFPSKLPSDVFERTPEVVDALAQRECQINGREFLKEEAGDVASLLRVVVNDNALM